VIGDDGLTGIRINPRPRPAKNAPAVAGAAKIGGIGAGFDAEHCP